MIHSIRELIQDKDWTGIIKFLLTGAVTGGAGEGLEHLAEADIYLSIILKVVSILSFIAAFIYSLIKIIQALRKKQ